MCVGGRSMASAGFGLAAMDRAGPATGPASPPLLSGFCFVWWW